MLKTGFVTSLAVTYLFLFTLNLSGDDGQSEKQSGKPAAKGATQQPSEAAVERTRDTVKMLDNIYKNAVVLITDKYVNDEEDFPAGSAAVELFKRVGKTGSHHVRLLDATGQPYEAKNVAKTKFEKQGIKQLKAGKPYYEEVIIKEGQPYLQAITPVPVVMKKCVMCHPHYKDAKPGANRGDQL